MIKPLLLGIVGTAILVGLGAWQVQRLDWKETLIARIEGRLSADPTRIPDDPDPQTDAFLRVKADGHLAEGVLYRLITQRPYGPGYQVIGVVSTGDRRILVDFGYIPDDRKGTVLPAAGTPVDLTGALFWPEPDAYAPAPDLAKDLVFSREVGPLADALGTEPVLVVAERHSLGDWPKAAQIGHALPNNHLNYAITWFSLAVVWAVMSGLWFRQTRRAARVG
ncbi:MAG: SURF1 family protein [Paracoccaceae bacterium]